MAIFSHILLMVLQIITIHFQTIGQIYGVLRLIYDFEKIMLSLIFNLPANLLFGGYQPQKLTILREATVFIVVSFLRNKTLRNI